MIIFFLGKLEGESTDFLSLVLMQHLVRESSAAELNPDFKSLTSSTTSTGAAETGAAADARLQQQRRPTSSTGSEAGDEEVVKKMIFLVGQTFLLHANGFKLYSAFCASVSKVQKIINPGE